MDITKNPNTKVESLVNVNLNDSVKYWDGFNHYEIDLKRKTLIHRFVGKSEGEKISYKIHNFVKTKEYYKFDIDDIKCGKMTYLIPLKKDNKYKLLIKYKDGDNYEVAFFENTPSF
jgi:hypothetical protein